MSDNTLTPLSLFKALSDATRLYCLLLVVSEKKLCVCELEQALKEEQPKISRHLALLRQNELLITERKGKWIYYLVNPELPEWIRQVIDIALENENIHMQVLKANLKNMENRPNMCC